MLTDLIGQQFGNFRLERKIGSGGFASVYLGQHVKISAHQAAIKILHLTNVDQEIFRKEAETTAALKHPHIVRLFDFDIEHDTPYLVMDYAPNGSLRNRHAAGIHVPLTTVIQYLAEIAPALQYAHEQGIIHRDIKPENILIGLHNELLLSDFGIAQLSETGRTIIATQYHTGGTPHYMAPEMFRGKPGKASDQYALAIMIYEWLCGVTPFTQGNSIQLGFQHTHEEVPSLRTYVPLLDERVENVILHALSKKAEDRYPSVLDFLQELEAAASAGPPAKSTSGSLQLTLRRHSARVNAIAWSPDHTRLASASHDTKVEVWNASNGEALFPYQKHASSVYAVVWSHNNMRLASASDDKTVQLWRTDTGQHIYTYDKHTSAVYGVTWSPDGTRIASASADKTVHVWRASNGQRLHNYTRHADVVWAVAWMPDGKLIASASGDGTVHIWHADTEQQRHIYRGHKDAVYAVAWSHDGTRIASASADHTVQVWDANTGQLHCTYSGHADWVRAVTWSPDDTRIASASHDKSVQIWNSRNGQTLFLYQKHIDHIYSVDWSPDGTRIASASADKSVHIWQI